jgi:hypothetical protein
MDNRFNGFFMQIMATSETVKTVGGASGST